MQTSETITKVIEALCLAQASFDTAKKNKANPQFKSKYADLANVFEAIRAPLAENGLAITQDVVRVDGANFLVTTLFHKSGEWMRTELIMPPFSKAQEMGSALSYTRRYSLMALLGITADDDDDGNTANKTSYKAPTPTLSEAQAKELEEIISGDTEYLKRIFDAYKVDSISKLPAKDFSLFMQRAKIYNKDKLEKEMANIKEEHKTEAK